MKLIVGLGNPGKQYQASRHNLGFLIIEHLARTEEIPLNKQGFDALYGKGRIGDEAVILAKPQTFMNLSGVALEGLLTYFKVDIECLIVIHDDLDLPFQTVRLKKGGGSGGHKGLISIIQHLGGAEFLRVRLGIGKPARKSMVESYVLSPFTEEEQKVLPRTVAIAAEAAKEMVRCGIQSAMLKYHRKDLNSL